MTVKSTHVLLPVHSVVPKEQEAELLKTLRANRDKLAHILRSDPAIEKLGAKVGDIIRIERRSFTAGNTVYFRVVV